MNSTEIKIKQLLNEMTISEKVSLCHANSKFFVAAIERLGIDELSMSDGPHGVRKEIERDSWRPVNSPDDYCTYLPTNTALAATWNPEMSTKFGIVLGEEARYRKKDIILGPGINIIRHPLCGRNFEYMSEEPNLIEKMAPPLIQGIQSCDTAACVKHFALNNQELDRGKVNVEVSDRALHEVYLKGFKASVQKGNAYSFMGAYNQYQWHHCCHNDFLVNRILKDDWGFDGVYLSDWAGTHDTEEAVFGGLDIEMGTNKPYNEYYLADAFEELANRSAEAREALDDKVRRILRLMFRIHKLSDQRKPGSYNTEAHQQATYDIASEAMVLLKNKRNVLPLKNAKKLLVVGENATKKHASGGNSSGVKALFEVSLLEGIQKRFADCEIEYIATAQNDYTAIPTDQLEIIDLKAGCRAFKCESFENIDFTGNCEIQFTAQPEAKTGFASHRYTCILNVSESRSYDFSFTGIEGDRIYYNGKILCKIYETKGGKSFSLDLKKGEPAEFVIKSSAAVAPKFLWNTEDDCQVGLDNLSQKAKEADYVIYCGGINHTYDTESFDRKDMKLPSMQNEEISAVLSANPNTVIAITAGSPVEMPWIDQADTVLWTWYAGMNSGLAFADILNGTINPSGKMPFTLPYRLEDSPAVRYGEYKAVNCKYNEGIFVGYKGFDKDNIDPMFCFGHGLSYTEFSYNDLSVEQNGDNIAVRFTIKNTGTRAGYETAQIYIGCTEADPNEPIRQLRGFEKVFLEAGQEKPVEIVLTTDDFKDYNEASGRFELLCKQFTIYAAASSRDLRLKSEIEIKS